MYNVQNPMDKAMSGMGQAANTFGRMGQDIPANRDPGPTAGGALMGGMGGALAGAKIGTMVSGGAGAGVGAGIGAVVGIGSYLLS